MHSAYYFEDRDWDQLFKYTDDVRVGVHLPERNNQVVPSDMPEFRWQYLDSVRDIVKHYGAVRAVSALAERVWLGVKHVAFEPLTAHGTTYVHRDLGQDIRRGGFHIVHYTRVVDEIIANPVSAAAMGAGVALAVGMLPRVFSKALRGQAPVWESAAIFAALAPSWLASGVSYGRNTRDPAPNARYTVKVVPGWDYVRQGETICRVYQMRRSPISQLEPRTISTRRPSAAKAREMAASMAMSGNPDKAARAAAAMGLRAGLSPNEVKDTVEAAQDYCAMIFEPKNGSGTASSESSPGTNQVLSVWDSTPSVAAVSLGKALMVGSLMTTLASESVSLIGHSPQMLETLRRYSTSAPWTLTFDPASMNVCSQYRLPAAQVKAFLEWARACAESCSQGVRLSQIAPSWQLTPWQSDTLRPLLIPWTGSSA
jgi:hypothetical protein